jgi:hypothetical protein
MRLCSGCLHVVILDCSACSAGLSTQFIQHACHVRFAYCRQLISSCRLHSALLQAGRSGAIIVVSLQVLEARIDHSRVVSILRKADHLPLVKDYLIAVQKGNLAAVNDAVNELLIEEEDFKVSVSAVAPDYIVSETIVCNMHGVREELSAKSFVLQVMRLYF